MRSIIKVPYYYFESALPPEMCNTIIELGKQKIQEDATINTDKSVDEKMRKGQVAWVKDEWLQQMIASYVARANSEAGWNFVINDREHIQFATYENEAFYDYHRDCDIDAKKYRKLSVSVQLSDLSAYVGGDLLLKNFWGNTNLPMDEGVFKQGTIIVFPSILLHTITPITQGTRYSLVQWFSGPDFI